MNRPNKGFTLMELLIVIGVLGILAAGLLAAIDPFEQLKKARDTNNRNAATELLQASQRYYSTHGYLPWFKQTTPGTYDCDGATLDVLRPTTADTDYPFDYVIVNKVGTTGHDADTTACLEETLQTDGEIKTTFSDGLSTSLYLTSGSKTRVGVCFSPEAKSNRTDPSTKYLLGTDGTIDEADAAVCPDVENEDCMQCFE